MPEEPALEYPKGVFEGGSFEPDPFEFCQQVQFGEKGREVQLEVRKETSGRESLQHHPMTLILYPSYPLPPPHTLPYLSIKPYTSYSSDLREAGLRWGIIASLQILKFLIHDVH